MMDMQSSNMPEESHILSVFKANFLIILQAYYSSQTVKL